MTTSFCYHILQLYRTTFWTRFRKADPDVSNESCPPTYENPAISTGDISLQVIAGGSDEVKGQSEPRKLYRDPGLDKGQAIPGKLVTKDQGYRWNLCWFMSHWYSCSRSGKIQQSTPRFEFGTLPTLAGTLIG